MKKRWIIAGMIAALCLSACSQGNSAADTAAKNSDGSGYGSCKNGIGPGFSEE